MWKKVALVVIGLLIIYMVVQFFMTEENKMNENAPPEMYNKNDDKRYNYRGIQYISEQVDQYPAYYWTKYSPMDADAEKCMQLPKVTAKCVNEKLRQYNGDMRKSIRECRADGQVNKTCTTNNYNKEFYPYLPQYVTPLRKLIYPVKVSLIAPKPMVYLVPDDVEQNYFNGSNGE